MGWIGNSLIKVSPTRGLHRDLQGSLSQDRSPSPLLRGWESTRGARSDLLTTSWSSLDSKLQQQLEQLGIRPPPPSPEPDLTDVLKENLSQLLTAVKELVEKITKPPPETERDMAMKLKAQVSTLRDLSHRKQVQTVAGFITTLGVDLTESEGPAQFDAEEAIRDIRRGEQKAQDRHCGWTVVWVTQSLRTLLLFVKASLCTGSLTT